MSVKKTLLAALAALALLAPAGVGRASTEAGPCQFLMPIEPGDVVECVHYILVIAIEDPFDA